MSDDQYSSMTQPTEPRAEVTREMMTRAADLLARFYLVDFNGNDVVGLRHGICGDSAIRDFVLQVEAIRNAAEAANRDEVERLPRLDEGLIEAALFAHYGKNAGHIDGVDLTVNGRNWTFRQGFKRMWAGIRKELKRRAATGEAQ